MARVISSNNSARAALGGKLKVLLADDHALFRDGMRHILHALDGGVEVIEAGDFRQALEAIDSNADIGLALVDLKMPGMTPFEGLKFLKKKLGDVPVVVVSALDSREHVLRSIECGASGHVPKTLNARLVLSALKLALSGGVFLPPALLDKGNGGKRDEAHWPQDEKAAPAERIHLTPRQRDVLAQLAKGRSNKLIARDLDLSEGTVKLHVTAVFRALGVHNRTQAVVKASELGLV